MKQCYRCGAWLNDNVNFCANCGTNLQNVNQNISPNNFNVPQYQTQVPVPSVKKKDSTLSIIACVFAGVGCIIPLPGIVSIPLIFVGMILGLIDLGINDKQKRHLGSWFAIIFCIIALIVLVL